MLTLQEAFNNIVTVVSNAKMTGPEHDSLRESIKIIAGRCEVADKLEGAIQGAKKEVKKLEEKKDGPTNEPTDVPRTDQENS